MTPDEARQVLVSARETAQYHQWQNVYDLLFPVHQEGILTGTEQGDAAFLLGEACRGIGAGDAAVYYYEEASSSGSSESKSQANERLAEITLQDAAVVAEDEGVVQNEADLVIRAGDEALANHDFATALGHYQAAYEGVVDGAPKFKAALGIARANAYLGNLDEAAQYADYVADSGGGDLGGQGKTLLEWIRDQQAATAGTADGTSPDEFKEAWEAAQGMFFSGAYDQALPIFLSAKESEQLGGVDRGRMAFNAAMCQRFLGDDAAAKELFEFAASHGPPATAAKAQNNIAMLAREEAAHELVAELAPD